MSHQPFFTIIEENGEIYHPQVHYIFEDDDPELLTSTAIDQLDGAKHRIVLIDTDGTSVTKVSSLSQDWQGIRAELTEAPSWGDEAAKGLMLRISGTEQATKTPNATLDELVASFDRDMESLIDVVGEEDEEETDG